MIIRLILNAIAFYIVAYLVPGIELVGVEALAVVAVVWGVLSILVKPVLVLLTLPINFLSLGLFSFVINAGLLLLTARLVSGFSIEGWWKALVGAVVLALVNMVLNRVK